MVGRMSLKELEAVLASPDTVVDPGPKSPKKYERAFARCEPHHVHKADIADLADEIADKWFKRAVSLRRRAAGIEPPFRASRPAPLTTHAETNLRSTKDEPCANALNRYGPFGPKQFQPS